MEERVKAIFKPELDEKSGFYKAAIYDDSDNFYGYLHWIESSDGSICRINALWAAKGIAETKESANAVCDELQRLYDNEEIG